MRKLDRYFMNPFDSKDISIAELIAGTADHLGKLIALSEGTTDYDEIITLTQVPFTALDGTITNEVVKNGIRKARTAALGVKRTQIHAELSRVDLLTQVAFPRGSETYIEIFPNGLTAFREAPVDGFENLLDALIEAASPHSESIGDLNPLIALIAQWKALRGDQLTKKGASADAAELRREASAALRLQLFDNLLFLARRNKGQPEECRNYFSQHLLEDPASPDDPEPDPVP